MSSYGLYQVDNTINSLAKVCGLDVDKTIDDHTAKQNKETIKEIKNLVRKYKLEDGSIDNETLLEGNDADQVKVWNKKYDNIVTHFTKLFGKVQVHWHTCSRCSFNVWRYPTIYEHSVR